TERLTELASREKGGARETAKDEAWRKAPVQERLSHALVNGITTYIVADTEAEKAKSGEGGRPKGRIVIATVKGDVHDIGKNIVSVVLQCNNYDVVNLGVMVPAQTIIETAQREKADAIGLSGLITPSLEEMSHVAREMERAGLKLPLLIGGATTSRT